MNQMHKILLKKHIMHNIYCEIYTVVIIQLIPMFTVRTVFNVYAVSIYLSVLCPFVNINVLISLSLLEIKHLY